MTRVVGNEHAPSQVAVFDRVIAEARATLFWMALAIVSLPLIPFVPLLRFGRSTFWWPVAVGYLDLMALLLKAICGIDYRIEGREHLPDGPVLLAARHESTWETLFFPRLFDNPVCFAKREIFGYPIVGRIATFCGHIPVGRDGDIEALRQAFVAAVAAVRSGRRILIFPSGTRKRDARDLKSGVSVLYAKLNVSCVPILLDSGRCWPPGSWAKYPGTIRVRILPPIVAGLDRPVFARVLAEALDGSGQVTSDNG